MVKILHKLISSVCPIDGVCIGKRSDKSTWRIDFSPTATKEQKEAARSIISSFDVSATEVEMKRIERRQRQISNLADVLIAKGLITEDDLK